MEEDDLHCDRCDLDLEADECSTTTHPDMYATGDSPAEVIYYCPMCRGQID